MLSTRARSVSESVMMSTTGHSPVMEERERLDDDGEGKNRPTYRPSKKRLKDTPDNQNIVANATEIFDPLKLPSKRYKIVKWLLIYPVRLLMHITIPDCRKEVFHNYYMLTFVMSTIWVSYRRTKACPINIPLSFFLSNLGGWSGLSSRLVSRYRWLYLKYSR